MRMFRRLLNVVIGLSALSVFVPVAENTENGLLLAARSVVADDVSEDALISAIADGIWNAEETVLAITVPALDRTGVFVFVVQPSGDYLAVDISPIEDALFRKLGLANRADYDQFETSPEKWSEVDGSRHLLQVRLRAWQKGQRYTVSGPVIIKSDGSVMWQ